jgi:hypothetical protein
MVPINIDAIYEILTASSLIYTVPLGLIALKKIANPGFTSGTTCMSSLTGLKKFQKNLWQAIDNANFIAYISTCFDGHPWGKYEK